jgi:tripartite-type tricarboxylate transporter receptor subunit TctC
METLRQQIARVTAVPEVRTKLSALGFDVEDRTPEEFAAHMQAESDEWAWAIREARIGTA